MRGDNEKDKKIIALAEELSRKIQLAKKYGKTKNFPSERFEGYHEQHIGEDFSYDSLRKQKTDSQNYFYQMIKLGKNTSEYEKLKHCSESNIFKPRRYEGKIIKLPDFDNYELYNIDVAVKIEIGTKVARNILSNWYCSAEDIELILMLNQTFITRLECISYILNIHASLRTMFDNPANQSGFMSMVNNDAFFVAERHYQFWFLET
ncbi:hypothetical protein [Enterovibrio coralii]|uniref:Uncharacterized protein n=1 Tax=Enterovibrio coralii TaxID=294935 RepID=A0A135IDV6_9GAMM|nr:hypothetical protein [Enterovibrio coralii]KXF83524.1 hypothetical protein ATN88_16795 [Enterovibrio coralii]